MADIHVAKCKEDDDSVRNELKSVGVVLAKADVVKLETMCWEQGRALNKPGCYLMWFVFGNHGLCYEVGDSYDCIVFMTGENMQNEPTWKTLSSTSRPIPGLNMSPFYILKQNTLRILSI